MRRLGDFLLLLLFMVGYLGFVLVEIVRVTILALPPKTDLFVPEPDEYEEQMGSTQPQSYPTPLDGLCLIVCIVSCYGGWPIPVLVAGGLAAVRGLNQVRFFSHPLTGTRRMWQGLVGT